MMMMTEGLVVQRRGQGLVN